MNRGAPKCAWGFFDTLHMAAGFIPAAMLSEAAACRFFAAFRESSGPGKTMGEQACTSPEGSCHRMRILLRPLSFAWYSALSDISYSWVKVASGWAMVTPMEMPVPVSALFRVRLILSKICCARA